MNINSDGIVIEDMRAVGGSLIGDGSSQVVDLDAFISHPGNRHVLKCLLTNIGQDTRHAFLAHYGKSALSLVKESSKDTSAED